MKKETKIVFLLLLSLLIIGGSFPIIAQAAGKAAISKETAAICVGKTVKLSMKNVKEGTKVAWVSSDPTVASVSSSGNVIGRKAGTATITATVNGAHYSCKVTVKVETVKIKKVKLSKTKATLKVNQTYQLKAIVTPGNATSKKVTWKSSNPKLATVSATGLVTAKKTGGVKITAMATDGSKKKATCTITVKTNQIKVKSVKLNKSKVTLALNQTYQLKSAVSPGNATNQKVTWKSSNSKVATISSTGLITARKKGSVTITSTAVDGSKKKATCKVTVKDVRIKRLAITGGNDMKGGETLQLGRKVTPSGANNLFQWKSSNSSVASVNANGKVTAKDAGTVKITILAKDGSGKTASCTIKVTKPQTASVSQGAGTNTDNSTSTTNPMTGSGNTGSSGNQSSTPTAGSGSSAGTSSKETEKETEAVSYYYDLSEIPVEMYSSDGNSRILRIKSNGNREKVTITVSGISSCVKVTSGSWIGSGGVYYYPITVTGSYTGENPLRDDMAILKILVGNVSKTVTVYVTSDKAEELVQTSFDGWVSNEFAVVSGFNAGTTPLEKLINVTKYIATTYDYSETNHACYFFWPEYATAHNTVPSGSCTASTGMLRFLAEKLGLKNETYVHASTHTSAYVVIDGEEYLFEAGIGGKTPRAWNVYKKDEEGHYLTIR